MIVQWIKSDVGLDHEPELYFHARELAAFLRGECDQEEAARIIEETIELTERRIASS